MKLLEQCYVINWYFYVCWQLHNWSHLYSGSKILLNYRYLQYCGLEQAILIILAIQLCLTHKAEISAYSVQLLLYYI